MLGRICIINAPMVFKAVWALIKPMLNPRTLNKIQVSSGQTHMLLPCQATTCNDRAKRSWTAPA
jgi:hypothetical protein